MARAQINGADIWYEVFNETGDKNPETILFSHGLLFKGEMFEGQVERLKSTYRCVIYDHRGQGSSSHTPPFDMDTLTTDAIGLIEHLSLGKVHFAGLSMGGFVGMRLAARHKEYIKSLILLDTSADPEVFVSKYNRLVWVVKLFGTGAVSGPVSKIMFAAQFRTDPSRKQEYKKWFDWLRKRPKSVVGPVRGVIDRKGVYNELGEIECPALVVVGSEDAATTPDKSERLCKAISGATLQYIPAAGHSSSIEQPQAVSEVIAQFLSSQKA